MGLRGALVRPRNQSPVPLVARRTPVYGMAGMGNGDKGTQLASYGAVGTLFQIVSGSASAIAGVEWKLYRKSASGKKEDRKEVTDHAALHVWNRPNPFMPHQEFAEVFQQHIELTGECWWVILRVNVMGDPIPYELWPIRPDKMEPIKDPTDFISGYVYRGPDGQRIELGTDEVIMIRTPNPEDPWRGMGPVQSILTDIYSTKYAAEYNANFFRNSAEPGGIISVEGNLNDDQYKRAREQWAENHRGLTNAHRVAILENNAKFTSMSYSQRDMQFKELRELSSEVIREAFGYPKPILGTVEDVNRANAEAADYIFGKRYLTPRLERIKAALNYEFLPLFPNGHRLEFDYESPAPADQEAEDKRITARVNALTTLVDKGFDPDEVCDFLELPRLKYSKPEPVTPAVPNPDGGREEDDDLLDVDEDEVDGKPPANELQLLNAMKYQAVAHMDENTCDPCKEVDGKLYRNLEEARKDFPNCPTDCGYKNCVGAKYGNKCRCAAVRRRGGKKK